MTSKPIVNGDSSHSQTINHVTDYPLIAELLKTFQSNSLGAKSVQAFNSAYETFVNPIKPYLQTPISIVTPYVESIDTFGDRSLTSIDNHFPALKSTDSEKLRSTASDVISFPFKVAGNTRDYAFETYNDEYKKTGGQGLVTSGKALISTQMRIVLECFHAVAGYAGPKKDEAVANYEKIKKTGLEKVDQARHLASEKTEDGKKVIQEKTEQAKQHANNVNSH